MDQGLPGRPGADRLAAPGTLPANVDDPRFAATEAGRHQRAPWRATDALTANLTEALETPAGTVLAIDLLGDVLDVAVESLGRAVLNG